jgi:hypothetical protein
MKTIEFELERMIRAPIDRVFARLVDIDGYDAWMGNKGSMLKHSRQTSPGEPTVGTTYVDETTLGPLPGEIVELEAHEDDRCPQGIVRAEPELCSWVRIGGRSRIASHPPSRRDERRSRSRAA